MLIYSLCAETRRHQSRFVTPYSKDRRLQIFLLPINSQAMEQSSPASHWCSHSGRLQEGCYHHHQLNTQDYCIYVFKFNHFKICELSTSAHLCEILNTESAQYWKKKTWQLAISMRQKYIVHAFISGNIKIIWSYVWCHGLK